jgi:hypothetical protein
MVFSEALQVKRREFDASVLQYAAAPRNRTRGADGGMSA